MPILPGGVAASAVASESEGQWIESRLGHAFLCGLCVRIGIQISLSLLFHAG